jgi:sulfur-oxidizing protein SoxZ
MATRALVHLPKVLRRGEPFEVRTTLAHAMETGYRRDGDGNMLPRDIVRRLEVRLGGETVFAADLHPAIAANPYVAFPLLLQYRRQPADPLDGRPGLRAHRDPDPRRDMKRALAWLVTPALLACTVPADSRRSGLTS